MAFKKCEYCDGETVITAENLNCMQDAILENEDNLKNHIIVAPVKPERKNVLWFNTDYAPKVDGLSLLSLDEDENGEKLRVEVEGETYGVKNATMNEGATAGKYDFTVL